MTTAAPFSPSREEWHRLLADDMLEAQLVNNIVRMAGDQGWRVIHQRPAVNRSGKWSTAIQGHRGFPDLVLAAPVLGRVLFRECKTQTGQLDPDQRRWRDVLLGAGADWALWRPIDWTDGTIERVLTRDWEA